MRMLTFAGRNTKEILRDPLTLFFGLGFPLVLILLLSAIQANIPVELFEIQHLTPGITVFGLSFMTLFSATIIAKDRGSALAQRLYTTPLTAIDFILGYTLPIIPIAVAQSVICYCFALIMGLTPTWNIIPAILLNIPTSIFFIGLGLLCGSLFNDKQVGGICGALLTNFCAWLSGAWIPLDLIGGVFRKVAYALPFVHATNLGKYTLAGNFTEIWKPLAVVSAYAVGIFVLSIFVFKNKISPDKI